MHGDVDLGRGCVTDSDCGLCCASVVCQGKSQVKHSTKRLLILICIWQNALADRKELWLKIQSIK